MQKILPVALCVVLGIIGFVIGRRTRKDPEVVWLSQFSGRYPIEQELSCPNGKVFGKLQIDLNLTNGKWRIVRNDIPAAPQACKGAK